MPSPIAEANSLLKTIRNLALQNPVLIELVLEEVGTIKIKVIGCTRAITE